MILSFKLLENNSMSFFLIDQLCQLMSDPPNQALMILNNKILLSVELKIKG